MRSSLITLVLQALPLGAKQAIGATAGFLFGCLPTREREIAHSQMQIFLGHTVPFRRITAHLGQVLAEFLSIPQLMRDRRFNISCEGLQAVRAARESQKPVICLTAHLGNWDLLAAYIISLGYPIVTVARPARMQFLQHLLSSVRKSFGLKIIWREENSSHGLKELVTAMKRGEILAALVDQDTRVRSLPIPFFGTPAATPSTLVELGKRLDAVFFSAFMVRTGKNNYHAEIQEISHAGDPTDILLEFNTRLESTIRKHPEQWVWFHKRWRTIFDSGGNAIRRSGREYRDYLKHSLIAENPEGGS